MTDAEGHLQTDPTRTEQILWDSRGGIWGTVPTPTNARDPLLRKYFQLRPAEGGEHTRRIDLGPPRPTWGVVIGLVLGPKDSMQGLDGHPDELYHVAPRTVACLIGQAALAAEQGAQAIRDVIGGDVELLAWIPKGPEGGTTPGALRPLQLPTCKMRYLGAFWSHIVGPVVEPQFSSAQAAKKGGNCRDNIRRAYMHLDPRAASPPAPGYIDDDLWTAVLEGAAGPVQALCDEAAHGAIDGTPACTFADQEKPLSI